MFILETVVLFVRSHNAKTSFLNSIIVFENFQFGKQTFLTDKRSGENEPILVFRPQDSEIRPHLSHWQIQWP